MQKPSVAKDCKAAVTSAGVMLLGYARVSKGDELK
jgi:hypothetical protein